MKRPGLGVAYTTAGQDASRKSAAPASPPPYPAAVLDPEPPPERARTLDRGPGPPRPRGQLRVRGDHADRRQDPGRPRAGGRSRRRRRRGRGGARSRPRAGRRGRPTPAGRRRAPRSPSRRPRRTRAGRRSAAVTAPSRSRHQPSGREPITFEASTIQRGIATARYRCSGNRPTTRAPWPTDGRRSCCSSSRSRRSSRCPRPPPRRATRPCRSTPPRPRPARGRPRPTSSRSAAPTSRTRRRSWSGGSAPSGRSTRSRPAPRSRSPTSGRTTSRRASSTTPATTPAGAPSSCGSTPSTRRTRRPRPRAPTPPAGTTRRPATTSAPPTSRPASTTSSGSWTAASRSPAPTASTSPSRATACTRCAPAPSTSPATSPTGSTARSASTPSRRRTRPRSPAAGRPPPLAVSVTGTDAHSGVAEVTWRVNGGAPTTTTSFPAGFSISTEGVNTVETRVRDAAGHQTGWKSHTVRIDTTAPTNQTQVSSGEWTTADYQVLVVAADSGGSGLAEVQWRIDGGPWANGPSGSQANVTGTGDHTLETRAIDVAGNASVPRLDNVRIDRTAPTNTTARHARHRCRHAVHGSRHRHRHPVRRRPGRVAGRRRRDPLRALRDPGDRDRQRRPRARDARRRRGRQRLGLAQRADRDRRRQRRRDAADRHHDDRARPSWRPTAITVTVAATDAGSGVKELLWRHRRAADQELARPTTRPSTSTPRASTCSRPGRSTTPTASRAWREQTFKVDLSVPVDTTAIAAGWSPTNTFTLSGTDALLGHRQPPVPDQRCPGRDRQPTDRS